MPDRAGVRAAIRRTLIESTVMLALSAAFVLGIFVPLMDSGVALPLLLLVFAGWVAAAGGAMAAVAYWHWKRKTRP